MRILALLGIGLSLGWLVGLSVSPVIQAVLGVLLTSIVGVVGALAGIQNPTEKGITSLQITPVPMFLLMIGIALGSTGGIMARTHGWLSPPPAVVAEAKTFSAPIAQSAPAEPAATAGLFATDVNAKRYLRSVEGEQLRAALLDHSTDSCQDAYLTTASPQTLALVRDFLLASCD